MVGISRVVMRRRVANTGETELGGGGRMGEPTI